MPTFTVLGNGRTILRIDGAFAGAYPNLVQAEAAADAYAGATTAPNTPQERS